MAEDYVVSLRNAVEAAKKAYERVERGEADRLEVVLLLRYVIHLLRLSMEEWAKWISDPEKLLVIPLEEHLRVLKTLFPHAIAILEEDARHTSWFFEYATALYSQGKIHPIVKYEIDRRVGEAQRRAPPPAML